MKAFIYLKKPNIKVKTCTLTNWISIFSNSEAEYFACIDHALGLSQQLFGHMGTSSCLPGINQY